jgi:hypothetical protein
VATDIRPPPEEVLSVLNQGEAALTFGWARAPRFGTAFATLFPSAATSGPLDHVRNRIRTAALRQTGRDLGVPLDRTMAVLVTSHRLLLWRASRFHRRVGAFLGEIPQSRVAAAKVPFSSGGPWRTLRLWMNDTTRIQFQVEAKLAESFTSALDKTATN